MSIQVDLAWVVWEKSLRDMLGSSAGIVEVISAAFGGKILLAMKTPSKNIVFNCFMIHAQLGEKFEILILILFVYVHTQASRGRDVWHGDGPGFVSAHRRSKGLLAASRFG